MEPVATSQQKAGDLPSRFILKLLQENVCENVNFALSASCTDMLSLALTFRDNGLASFRSGTNLSQSCILLWKGSGNSVSGNQGFE